MVNISYFMVKKFPKFLGGAKAKQFFRIKKNCLKMSGKFGVKSNLDFPKKRQLPRIVPEPWEAMGQAHGPGESGMDIVKSLKKNM